MGGEDVLRLVVERGVEQTTLYVRKSSSTPDVDLEIVGEDPPKNGLDSMSTRITNKRTFQ